MGTPGELEGEGGDSPPGPGWKKEPCSRANRLHPSPVRARLKVVPVAGIEPSPRRGRASGLRSRCTPCATRVKVDGAGSEPTPRLICQMAPAPSRRRPGGAGRLRDGPGTWPGRFDTAVNPLYRDWQRRAPAPPARAGSRFAFASGTASRPAPAAQLAALRRSPRPGSGQGGGRSRR